MLRSASTLALACALLTSPAGVEAQSVRLDQYRMAETPVDGFVLSRPNDMGHLRFGARLDVAYSLNPLVYQLRTSDPTTELAPVVEHLVGGTLGVSFGLFDRLVVYAGLPVNLVMEGARVDGQPRADGSSLGDVYFGLRGRLFGEAEEPFALSLQVTGTGPTAQAARFQSRFAGEGDWTVHPEVLFEVRIAELVRITGNLGALVREEQDFGALRVGHEFTWGGGVAVGVVPDVLDVVAETWGSTALDRRFGDGQLSPILGVLGVRVYPVDGLSLGVMAGGGLQRGYGAGDFSTSVSVGYATPGEVPAGDRDEDGILDDVDECPDEPEDVDQFSDADGCPDPDNDQDGLPDADDECPDQPEDMDGLGDADGCPEEDFDGDGAPDTTDRCPTVPGIALAVRPDCTGCPTCDDPPPPPPVEEEEPIVAPPPVATDFEASIYFDVGDERIRRSQLGPLQDALAYLQQNPGSSLHVEGHADFRGHEPENDALSRARARRVMRWLARHGVAVSRLSGSGCGERYPVDDNETREGRRRNRRADLRPNVRIRTGCVDATLE